MSKSTTSLRLDDQLRERLADMAEVEGTSVSAVVERLLREGIAMAEHPGIVFRPGPSGRRAALACGPDVWEIAMALPRFSGSEMKRVAALAEEFGLHEQQVVIALNYAAAHRHEIEARIRANEKAFEEVGRVAEERKRLFV